MHAVEDQGFSCRCVISHFFAKVDAFCDTSSDQSSNWHLVFEIKSFSVVKFIQPNTNRAVVTNLNEASRFWNVSYIACKQIALVYAEFRSKFKNFVSKIALFLVFGIELLKLGGWIPKNLWPASYQWLSWA